MAARKITPEFKFKVISKKDVLGTEVNVVPNQIPRWVKEIK